MSTPTARAHGLRATLVGLCSAVATVGAHTAAAGAMPHGAALVAALLVCATAGATAGAVTVAHRHAQVVVLACALGAAQLLSHLTLSVTGGHHHGDLGFTPSMIAAHAVAAVVLGIAIAAVEHLYRVCASVLCWLRLFAARNPVPAPPRLRRRTNNVVAQSVLLAPGLGMWAPPMGDVATA